MQSSPTVDQLNRRPGALAATANLRSLPATVVISTRNRREMLEETVQALLRGSHTPAELVIVDQSDRPSGNWASRSEDHDCRIRYLHTPVPGVSAARNLGARSASHEMVVFMDDDLTADQEWLAAFVTRLMHRGAGTVCTGQVREVGLRQGSFAPSCTEGDNPVDYSGFVHRDVLSSGNMALYRSALETVGGFDERLGPGGRYPAAEDNDLGFRLLRAGYTIEYLPEALAWHRAWRTEEEVIGLKWRYGLGQGAFYAKHVHGARRYVAQRILQDLTRPLRSLPERVRSRRARRLVADWIFAAGVVTGLLRWLAVSR